MNTLKGFAPALLLTFSALCVCARAQTPAAETEAQAPQESTDAAAPQEALAPTGAGTAGKLAKWTTATNLGNSVVTESSYRVGINSAFPSAMLQVNGPQPAPRATSGAPALALLLQTTGGKGGNTTGTTGQAAGAGAGIYLYAGPGGDAPAGSRTGDGGNIILQPGWRGGGGGAPGSNGNVLLTPNRVGYVGIGTSRPTAQLHVVGGTSIGVYGQTDSTIAVYGRSQSWVGVYGYSPGGSGVFGQSASGTGVWGASLSGYAGFFAGKAKVSGNLEVGSCTGCSIFSDSALKANFSMIDTRSVLDKLAALPIKEWSYKSDSPSVRHLGPMAQDFKEAFNLGADDKHIDMVDANGVTMASVQALYRMMLEKDEEIKQLRTQMAQQQAQLNQVRRAIRRRRARVRAR